jgi:hypothetical protein
MVVKKVRLAFKDRQTCSKRHKEALEGPAFQTGRRLWPNLFVRHAGGRNLIILYILLPSKRLFKVLTENEVL